MNLNLSYEKCILCLNEPAVSPEHIIPECVGGRLALKILCSDCNHVMGYTIVTGLCNHQLIQDAMVYLKHRLPKKVTKHIRPARYISKSPDGNIVHLEEKKGRLVVVPREINNHFRIKDSAEAEQDISILLKKKGQKGDADEMIQRFRNLEIGESLSIGEDIFRKQELGRIDREIDRSFVDERLLVLIAYEFLSLTSDKRILSARFDQVRSYVLGSLKENPCSVEEYQVLSDPEPMHSICALAREERLVTEIRFFNSLAYTVEFPFVKYLANEVLFVDDLENSLFLVADSLESAAKGNWAYIGR